MWKQDFPVHLIEGFLLKFKVLFCSLQIKWCLIILQREYEAEKHSTNPDKQLNNESETKISQKPEKDTLENLRNYGTRAFPTVLTLAMQNAIQEDEITIALENQENFSKGTVLK